MRSPAPTLRLLIVILSAGCLNALRVAAQDGPSHVPNLDTMVANARFVVVGRIVERFPNREGSRTNVDFAVEQRLKGDVSDRTQVLIKAPEATLDGWKEQGHRLLIANGVSEGLAIDLSAPKLKVLRADMTVLQDADSVIGAAEEAIRNHPGVSRIETFVRTIPNTARMLLPDLRVSCVPENLYSLCHVTPVPVDEALERWALDAIESTQVWERAEGAGALRHFPTDANIARLKALLGDPGLQPSALGAVYSVRRRAYEALSSIGVRVPEPAERP